MRSYNAHETARMQEVHGARLASFPRRAFAFILDFLVAYLVFLAILIPVGGFAARQGWIPSDLTLEFDFKHWYSLVLLVVYFAVATFLGNGKTPGKWMMGIRTVSMVHRRMSLWHSFERGLGYAASFLEFGFGFAQYFIHPNRRTVHDRIAETVVVQDRFPAATKTSTESEQ